MKNVYKIVLTVLLISIWTIPMATPALANTLSTDLDIYASATEVSSGDTIQLTIDETNDGELRLKNVSVDLYEDSTHLMTLSYGSIGWQGGDTDGDGELDAGETWSWEVTVTVIANTTYTAIGYAEPAPSQFQGLPPVTWPDDPEEKDSVDITVTNGGEGCTPGWWKNHLDSWIGYSPGDDFDSTFGVDWFAPDITLEKALNMRGGGIKALTRHAAAALLNAAHPDVDYPMAEADIISAVHDVDSTDKKAVTALKDTFDENNNLGCGF